MENDALDPAVTKDARSTRTLNYRSFPEAGGNYVYEIVEYDEIASPRESRLALGNAERKLAINFSRYRKRGRVLIYRNRSIDSIVLEKKKRNPTVRITFDFFRSI